LGVKSNHSLSGNADHSLRDSISHSRPEAAL
jgi:hypothetical protein